MPPAPPVEVPLYSTAGVLIITMHTALPVPFSNADNVLLLREFIRQDHAGVYNVSCLDGSCYQSVSFLYLNAKARHLIPSLASNQSTLVLPSLTATILPNYPYAKPFTQYKMAGSGSGLRQTTLLLAS